MSNLQHSFEDVADWCEKHLHGRGTTLGAALRIYGKLASLPRRPNGQGISADWKALTAKAEGLLTELSDQSIDLAAWDDQRQRVAEPASVRLNMIYDSSPH